MYGIVVMAALAAGGESPEVYYPRATHSCYGCYGYGCLSAGCSGCCSGYSGCCSGWGGACYGSYSCSGSCWGGACYGSYSCCGGACYGSSWSCWGCYGCWSTSPYAPMYLTPSMQPAEMRMGTPADPMKKVGAAESDRAHLVIEVPVDAKLYIDDQLMKTTSEKRIFNTPKLDKGQTYYYMLRVEVAREGVTHSESRRVLIKAGDDIQQAFTETTIAVASRGSSTASR